MFVISITYTSPLDVIDQFLSEHLMFLETQYLRGNFQLSGRKNPRAGGVILATVANRADLENILDFDPFKRECLAHYEIIEFFPTKSSEKLGFLLEQ